MTDSIHDCSCRLPDGSYGAAIDSCYELPMKPGKLFVTNGEYVSQVFFCPFCGEKAAIEPEIDKKAEL